MHYTTSGASREWELGGVRVCHVFVSQRRAHHTFANQEQAQQRRITTLSLLALHAVGEQSLATTISIVGAAPFPRELCNNMTSMRTLLQRENSVEASPKEQRNHSRRFSFRRSKSMRQESMSDLSEYDGIMSSCISVDRKKKVGPFQSICKSDEYSTLC